MPNFISEDQIEQALLQKLQHVHGYDVLDCYTENAEDLNDGSGRAHKRDVILAELKRQHHHITNTAKALGLERSHLYKTCQRLGIDLSAAREER